MFRIGCMMNTLLADRLEHDREKVADFSDKIMIQNQ